MDDSNEDDHAKTLPKEHDRDAAIDDARKAPEELIRHFQTSGRSRTHTSPHQSSTIKDTL